MNSKPTYFDIERDKIYPYFCEACLLGKRKSQMSKADKRYCSQCQPSIEADCKLRREKYSPILVTNAHHKPSDANLTSNSGTPISKYSKRGKEVLLHMKSKKKQSYQNPTLGAELNLGVRPRKDIPIKLILKLSSDDGFSIGKIVKELEKQGLTISPMTVSRVLSGQRQ